MPIPDWPKEDRPREKLLDKGAHMLTDAELIAIFFKTGTREKSALDLAKSLLVEHGGLKQLMQTPTYTILQTHGIGYAKYAALKAAIELGKRYQSTKIQIGEVLNNSSSTQKFLADHLKDHHNEVFACLFLDNHFRLISFEELFHGTIHGASVYPREIIKRGLQHNAAKIILAHNHPSGLATPSEADQEVTKLIKYSLSLIDIEVVDHIIIGNDENFSFADMGLLD